MVYSWFINHFLFMQPWIHFKSKSQVDGQWSLPAGFIWMDITRLPEKQSYPLKHILMSVYVGSAFDVYYYYYFQFGWYRTSEYISM